jgi:RNA polymerase sigma factor (sigma-70 family)
MTPGYAIFVVDDDKAVRDSLRWLLESVGHPVETYDSAREFLTAYNTNRSGCLVVDVRMPGMSGLELQELLASREISIPIIIITGHGDVPMAVQAMKAGAVDFIEKPFNDQVLLDRIQFCLLEETKQRQDKENKAQLIERIEQLTPREREVLEGVVAGKLNKVIADELGISIKTVEIHRSRVMEKMSAGSLAELVAMCIQAGIYKGKP